MEEISDKISLKFPKEERLHHRSLVEGLFRHGKSFYEFPFRVNWRRMDIEEFEKNFRNSIPCGIGCLQMMVAVPKKKRRHAVDRVLLRRRIREAYRLNRLSLRDIIEESEIRHLGLALIYTCDKNLPYSVIEEKIKTVLEKLRKKIEEGRNMREGKNE